MGFLPMVVVMALPGAVAEGRARVYKFPMGFLPMVVVMALPGAVAESRARAYNFLREASFAAETVGYVRINAHPWRFPGDASRGFNPGLALLPPSLAAELRRVREWQNKTGEPRYVATFRVRGNLCEYLAEDAEKLVFPPPLAPPAEERRRRRLNEPGFASSVAILDEELNVLEEVYAEAGAADVLDAGRDDIRLDSREAFGARILTTSMNYPFVGDTRDWYAEWRVLWLDLTVEETSGAVTAAFRPVDHDDVRDGGRIVDGGRNFGVLWTGDDSAPFSLVHWLATTLDVRRGVPPRAPPLVKAKPFVPHHPHVVHGGRKLVGPKNKTLHNNINPVDLGAACPGYSLTIGHLHLDNTMPAYQYRTRGATGSGNTYAHAFVVFTTDPPYRVCAQSQPFCFPAADRPPNECDTVQFVTGAVLRPQDDTFLFTYGVNDCDSAAVTMPVHDVLDLAFNGNKDIPPCACAAAVAAANAS